MKQFIVVLLAVCFPFCCIAQNNSRIVFLRMDAPVGERTTKFKEGRLYTDGIYFNGNEIGKIRSCSVFVYDDSNATGTYLLKPAINKDDEANQKLAIHPPKHSVTIIKFKLSANTPITSDAEVVEVADFYKCYANNKWLRQALAEAGYYSVTELVAGYTISGKEAVAVPVNEDNKPKVPANILKDTLFYNSHGNLADKQDASYYEIVRPEPGHGYVAKKYYASSHHLKMDGHYSAIDTEKMGEGLFTFYNENGRIDCKGSYHLNKGNGQWIYYYDTTNSPVWYQCNFTDGHWDGELSSYYLSGRLKRKEYHQFRFNLANLRSRNSGGSSNGSDGDTVMNGKCYDEYGKEMKFTPFAVMPVIPYDLNKYLAKSIKYPKSARKNNIEGRVIVRFAVGKDGTISDVEIMKHVSPDLDDAAAKVIAKMPQWEPGKLDDKPVDVYYTIPIRFKLE